MPAIALLSQKGGTGKTTLAAHLAVASGDALIIDTDKQKSSAGWWREREGDLPEMVTATAQSVPKALAATSRHGCLSIPRRMPRKRCALSALQPTSS